jgi:hypothetical protein
MVFAVAVAFKNNFTELELLAKINQQIWRKMRKGKRGKMRKRLSTIVVDSDQ